MKVRVDAQDVTTILALEFSIQPKNCNISVPRGTLIICFLSAPLVVKLLPLGTTETAGYLMGATGSGAKGTGIGRSTDTPRRGAVPSG